MNEVSRAPQGATDAPPAALLTIAPRPTAPRQKLTAVPLAHDLDPYTIAANAKPTVAPAYIPTPPFRAPLGRELLFDRGAYDASCDRFQHAADRAFGEDLPGGSAA